MSINAIDFGLAIVSGERVTRYHGTSLLMDSIKAESCIHEPASLCFKKCCSAWDRYEYNVTYRLQTTKRQKLM